MKANNIVIGQKVAAEKIERAKELRRSMTDEEEVLWQCLRKNHLDGFHFRRQQVIHGFIADFYCHAVGLVIEVDGEIHRLQDEYDSERDQALKGIGLRVLRVTNEDIRRNLSSVLAGIRAACNET